VKHPLYVEPRQRPATSSNAAPEPRPSHPGSLGAYAIHTWGCQMNFHDSEKLAGQLESLGYAQTDDDAGADVILLNTCSVREKADDKVFTLLGRLKAVKKRNPSAIIGVCGCVAQQLKREFFQKAPHLDLVLGPQAINHLPRHLELVRRKRLRVVDTVQHREFQDYAGPAVRRGAPPKAWVTVQEGCDKFCTYCIIPHTRGREANRSYRSILQEVEQLAGEGYREVELLGQNVNSWFEDPSGSSNQPAVAPQGAEEGGIKDLRRFERPAFAADAATAREPAGRLLFSDLLLGVANVQGVHRVRFITSHPSHFSDRIIEAVASQPAVCPHVHLPVQSGSDRVLERMRRGHTLEEFIERVEALRAAVPEVAISTDIIVGFLGETARDHEESLDLLRRVEFDFIYSFMYSPRPFTRAARWEDDVPAQVKLARLQEVQAVQKEIQGRLQEARVGRVYDVLVDGVSRRDAGEVCGRTPQWGVVNFPGASDLHGRTVPVRITKAHLNSLSGLRVE